MSIWWLIGLIVLGVAIVPWWLRSRRGRRLRGVASMGVPAAVELLLEKGTDVNAKDKDGQTPLHLAVHWGHADVVKVLLYKGADVNAKTQTGLTPKDYAAEAGNADVMKLLSKYGAEFGDAFDRMAQMDNRF